MGSVLVNLLNSLTSSIRDGDTRDLKNIANDAIKEATLNNDPKLAKTAVLAYTFYKFYSKEHIIKNDRWPKVREIMVASLEKSIQSAMNNKDEDFNKNIQSVVKEIKIIDDRLSNYARNIYEKAKIKQASTAYALGMSIGQSAELTGADPKQLQLYIGATKIHDEQKIKKGLNDRLNSLKELLKE
tara:strand:+ start:5112 stop:5666 length:555 start_codon:yes stop_codon:yes gene_type:complete